MEYAIFKINLNQTNVIWMIASAAFNNNSVTFAKRIKGFAAIVKLGQAELTERVDELKKRQ